MSSDFFNDDDDFIFDDVKVEEKRDVFSIKVEGGTDPEYMIDLVTRVEGLRFMPVGRDKIPFIKGWGDSSFWKRFPEDAGDRVRAWTKAHGQPNYAFVLGLGCGRLGDMVIEADNQAGEDWCLANLPSTGIANVTRKGYLHRHFACRVIDGVGTDGNVTDIFQSKKKHTQESLAAGFDVVIDKRRRNDKEYLAHVAAERIRALEVIELGPIVDIKCHNGQAMCPGSVRGDDGYVYKEASEWTQAKWDARPVYDPLWFGPEIWIERERIQSLSESGSDDVDIDDWWTPERRMSAARKYMEKVPPTSSGQDASGTFMRLATVLVRGFALTPVQARELATHWGQVSCSHEPWSRKEIEHKLRQANDRGTMAFGEFLKFRRQNQDTRLEQAEIQVQNMIESGAHRYNPSVHGLEYHDFEENEEEQQPEKKWEDGVVEEKLAEVIELEGFFLDDDDFDDSSSSVKKDPGSLIRVVPTPDKPIAVSGSHKDQLRNVMAMFKVNLADVDKSSDVYHTQQDKEGNIVSLDPTTNTLTMILTHSQLFKDKFKKNEMSEDREFCGKIITDATELEVKSIMDNLFRKELPKERIHDAIERACTRGRYNPVVDYLQGLPEWDGVERWKLLPKESISCHEDDELAATILTRFALSAIHRALEPGCKSDCMLVLQSRKQGFYKSTFGIELFGESNFTDQPIDIRNRDSRTVMHRHWCIEVGEGEIMSSPKNVMAFKAFMSQRYDDLRLPYARNNTRLLRRNVFIGTTNETAILHDSTGNRRFHILRLKGPIKIGKIREWRDQLWAEVLTMYRDHVDARNRGDRESEAYVRGRHWFTEEEDQKNDKNNEENAHEDAWEADVYEFLAKNGRKPFLTKDVLGSVGVETGRRDWSVTRRVTEILRRLGCDKHKNGQNTTVDGRRGKFWDPPENLIGDEPEKFFSDDEFEA